MSTCSRILKRRTFNKIQIDRFAMPNKDGAAARKRRKKFARQASVTRAVLKRVN